MNDEPNIHQAAQNIVDQLGRCAFCHLGERAEIALLTGDWQSAIAWREIAFATIDVLDERLREPGPQAAGDFR